MKWTCTSVKSNENTGNLSANETCSEVHQRVERLIARIKRNLLQSRSEDPHRPIMRFFAAAKMVCVVFYT